MWIGEKRRGGGGGGGRGRFQRERSWRSELPAFIHLILPAIIVFNSYFKTRDKERCISFRPFKRPTLSFQGPLLRGRINEQQVLDLTPSCCYSKVGSLSRDKQRRWTREEREAHPPYTSLGRWSHKQAGRQTGKMDHFWFWSWNWGAEWKVLLISLCWRETSISWWPS